MLKSALIASIELTNKQPDIFNDKSLFLTNQILNAKNLGDEFILLALKHLKHAALLHELNRQNIMNVGVLASLKSLLKTNNTEVSTVNCKIQHWIEFVKCGPICRCYWRHAHCSGIWFLMMMFELNSAKLMNMHVQLQPMF